MDYRKEIDRMLRKIGEEQILRYVWIIVCGIMKDLGLEGGNDV